MFGHACLAFGDSSKTTFERVNSIHVKDCETLLAKEDLVLNYRSVNEILLAICRFSFSPMRMAPLEGICPKGRRVEREFLGSFGGNHGKCLACRCI